MTRLNQVDVVKGIRDLPALPLVVSELIRSFDNPNVNTGTLADSVSKDQALAAKTLRLANSSFYGMACKVKTVQQAVAVVGFDSVRSMIVAVGIIDAFAHADDAHFNFPAFWRHSIATALCARSLAQACNVSSGDSFICGLLHDIGTLVLVTVFRGEYAAAMRQCAAGDMAAIDAERDLLGMDHATVGRTLAEHWKFPLLIQEAIASHHAPMIADYDRITSVVHVADAIAHALDFGGLDDDVVPMVVDKVWDSLQLDSAVLHQVFHETESEFGEACQILCS